MKKIILFILSAIALLPASAFAQKWETIDSIYIPGILNPNAKQDVYFVDALMSGKNNIMVLANVASESPYVIKSTDLGITWSYAFKDSIDPVKNTRPKARSLVYTDSSLVIFTQENGYYYRSSDNGESWKQYSLKNWDNFMYMGFWDNKNGLVSIYHKKYDSSYIFFQKTSDGGLSWYDINMPLNHTLAGTFLYTTGDSIAYVVEIDPKIDSAFFFYKSTNMGRSWQNKYLSFKMNPAINPNHLFFCNENLVFHYGGRYLGYNKGDASFINRSTDGGHTWQKVLDTAAIPRNPVEDMDFCDSLNGIASAWGLIWRTSDGGLTWNADTSFDYKRFPQYTVIVKAIDKDHSLAFAMLNDNYIYRYAPDNETTVEQGSYYQKLYVSPNPAFKYIHIDPLTIDDEVNYSIYDIMGIKRLEGVLKDSRIDVESLRPGVFFLVLQPEHQVIDYKAYSKFIKE